MKWSWPKGKERWLALLRRYQYAAIAVAAGVVLLLLAGGGESARDSPEQQSARQEESFDLEDFEDRLEKALSQLEGAGQVQVVLTLKSGSRQVLAQDLRREEDGGSQSETVVLDRDGSGEETVALQTFLPQFRGALVLCPGADDPSVRLSLIQAVAALTGLGSDRISVCTSAGG